MLATPVWAYAQLRQITVTGQGAIQSAPDMATITIGVTTEAKTAADALGKNSTATTAVLNRLSSFGIDRRDLQPETCHYRRAGPAVPLQLMARQKFPGLLPRIP
jgi:uncharacterized protein YggE